MKPLTFLYNAKLSSYTRPVTLFRKVLLAVLLAGLYHLALAGLLWAIQFPLTYWPAVVSRLGLVILGGPAQIAANWVKLHLGLWLLPQFVWDVGLALIYIELVLACVRLTRVIQAHPQGGRRAFLATGTAAVVTATGVNYAYGEVQVNRRELTLKDLPPSLAGLKVAMLADLHRGPVISKAYLQSVVEQVNSLEPDLVLLPGDFVSKSDTYFPDVTDLLSGLKPKIASLATLGNHDHWEGTEKAKEAVTKSGVLLLHNSCLHLTPDRQLSAVSVSSGLCLAGVDDLWAGKPDLALALAGVSPSVPRLLLSHNPDFAEEQDALALQQRVDLQLSGHTHGGQVILPGLGAATTGSRYGMKYLYGEAEGPQWPVYTTRGIGTSIIPVRVGAPPEVVLFTLS